MPKVPTHVRDGYGGSPFKWEDGIGCVVGYPMWGKPGVWDQSKMDLFDTLRTGEWQLKRKRQVIAYKSNRWGIKVGDQNEKLENKK